MLKRTRRRGEERNLPDPDLPPFKSQHTKKRRIRMSSSIGQYSKGRMRDGLRVDRK